MNAARTSTRWLRRLGNMLHALLVVAVGVACIVIASGVWVGILKELSR